MAVSDRTSSEEIMCSMHSGVNKNPTSLVRRDTDDSDSGSDVSDLVELSDSRVAMGPYTNCGQWAFRLWIALYAIFGERSLSCLRRHVSASSHFSGQGTFEVALTFLKAAAAGLSMPVLRVCNIFACDSSPGCRRVLQQRLGGTCIYKDIMAMLGWGTASSTCVQKGRLDYEAACRRVASASIVAAPCHTHGGCCPVRAPDVDVSGSPCTPWTNMLGATRLKRKHPLTLLLLIWCQIILTLQVPLVIHENVVGFDVSVLTELLGHAYEIITLHVSPLHSGYGFLRRPRLYCVLVLRSALRIVRDIQKVYDEVVRRTAIHGFAPTTAWPWQASDEQLCQAENTARKRRHLPPLEAHSEDWSYLLTSKQQEYLDAHMDWWQRRHLGANVPWDSTWVIDVSQRPAFTKPSAAQMPTFRRANSFIWSPARRRWLLPIERAAAMGFPVFLSSATVAGVPVDAAFAEASPATLGNAMHVANVGYVFLISLACVEPVTRQHW